LIDPLAVRDLAPLARALADATVVKVLHGADYDVTSLKRDFGFTITRVFDTMLAARFLGLPEVGLQAVLRHELGVTVSKSSQKDDWSVRPLTPLQEHYALADVRHLLALHERFAERLRAQGRLGWVEEESAAVAALEPVRRERDPDGWLRIKGARALAPRPQAVLRELHGWREGVAESTDVPAFRIVSPQALLALAQAPPRDERQVQLVPGLPRMAKQRAGELLAAVARAQALPEDRLPRASRERPPLVAPPVKRRVEALRAWRAEAAKRLALDVSLVLPQRLLDKVAEAAPRDRAGLEHVAGLRRWRVQELGEEILRVLLAAEGVSR
ncbi:MAG TPA: HRDC domain-containing protein, partial [Vicinamibacteria bacterium]|nr:HRDC domain-containing protein [Vicinamibacteria bacterium]